jgi:phosphoglycolate phosphatase
MSVFNTIFWDWNGTLLDDVDECIDIINASLKKRSLTTIDREEYLEKFTFPIKKYYENIGFDFTRESYEAAGQEYIDAYGTRMFECRLHNGVRNTLDRFRSTGTRQFVLSALYDQALHQCISHFRLSGYFDKVRGLSDSYAHSKVELGCNLIKECGCDKNSAIMVGDTLHDFDTAVAMGIPCVLIAAGHNSKKRLQASGAPVFDSIEEFACSFDRLPDLLKR